MSQSFADFFSCRNCSCITLVLILDPPPPPRCQLFIGWPLLTGTFLFRLINCLTFFQIHAMPKKSPRYPASDAEVDATRESTDRRPSRTTKRPRRYADSGPMLPLSDHSPVPSTSTGAGSSTGDLHAILNSLQSMQTQITRLEARVAATPIPGPPTQIDADTGSDLADLTDDPAPRLPVPRESRARKRTASAGRRSRTRSPQENRHRRRHRTGKRTRHQSPPSSSSMSGEDESVSDSSGSGTDF